MRQVGGPIDQFKSDIPFCLMLLLRTGCLGESDVFRPLQPSL